MTERLDTSRPHRYRWNGTVAAYAWKTAGETRQRGYSLLYDGLDRLTAAYYGEGTALGSYYSIYDGRAAYDDMGNFSFKREKSMLACSSEREKNRQKVSPVWIYRKLPADENDKTMKGYSARMIKNSKNSILLKTFDFMKYLETQAYLK